MPSQPRVDFELPYPHTRRRPQRPARTENGLDPGWASRRASEQSCTHNARASEYLVLFCASITVVEVISSDS